MDNSDSGSQLGETHKNYGIFAVVAGKILKLTYLVPDTESLLSFGDLCLVPMHVGASERTFVAIFLEFCPETTFKCLFIKKKLNTEIEIKSHTEELIRWVHKYYATPLEYCLPLAYPGFIFHLKKHDMFFRLLNSSKKSEGTALKKTIPLNPLSLAQNEIYESIQASSLLVTLLHGVTGSGKTEIYLRLSADCLAQGKRVLVLVPEIALTPQVGGRFQSHFGDAVAIIHSGISSKEYMRQWIRIYKGEVLVVLGVRTSVFVPIDNLGLIIVDEEHDLSYKSSEMPAYHARDVAIVKSKSFGCPCILGSATPSVETYYNAVTKKYHYAFLSVKYSCQPVTYRILDAREEMPISQRLKKQNHLRTSQISFGDLPVVSMEILEEIKKTKEENLKSMVLINRRGYVNYALCTHCYKPLLCPKCSVTTTLHNKGAKEICHYCNYQNPTRLSCPSCGSRAFSLQGLGVQQVEDKIAMQLPQVSVGRLDRDVLTSHTRISKILSDFQSGDCDCLVGTQLIAKGHDFAKVAFIAILHLEDLLYLPDFRAGERTFQLLTQAMGRVGRGEHPGKVFLQSFARSHNVITYALQQKTIVFLQEEIQSRALGWLPPYSRQILIEVAMINQEKALAALEEIKQEIIHFCKNQKFTNQELRLAGPYPATLEKLNGNYRYHLCITTKRQIHPQKVIPSTIWDHKKIVSFIKIDVDPYSFL